MNDALAREFQSPGPWHRGSPFWAWNGRLEPEELRRQVRLMKRMGLGGFFMHSRVGLDTPYLSADWFACVEACVEEARAQGMLAWLYDEDRWPSGAAGGLVTREERWRRRSLVMQEIEDPEALAWTEAVVAAFRAVVEGSAAREVRRIARGQRPESLAAGERILCFRVEVDAPSNWYNGTAYLDTLNPQAVKRFIAVTHEAYRKRFSGRFGAEVPGIFTDEPNHAPRLGGWKDVGLPWTRSLPSVFRERYGYDLLPHLVELYLDVDGAPMTPARWHYHDCVTHLFVDSFARQVGQWCAENGLAFTGHVLEEDTLSRQTRMAGSPMRFYEHMEVPGMDLLTERWRAYTTAKQVSSAARQFGRRWRLSETYGCTGWDFPFAGHKALGDWQVALGINLLCPHLAWYTMAGEAKRDYPAAVGWQSPWWELYPKVQDYFGRVMAAMSRGEEVRDLLVVHPVESAWTMVHRGWLEEPRVQAFDAALVSLEDTLLAAHLDFDYGDEEILSRRASVSRRGGTPSLKVGKAAYTAVVIPPMLTVRSTTLALLQRFLEAGGRVVFAGEPAAFVDAAPSPKARDLAARAVAAPATGPELAAAAGSARRIQVLDPGGVEIGAVLYQLRDDADSFTLFLCNTGLDAAVRSRDLFDEPRVVDRRAAFPSVRVRLAAATDGVPTELDPETGAEWATEAARAADGSWTVTTSLPALGSRLFRFPKAAEDRQYPQRPKLTDARRVELDGERWDILLSEENVLPLDRPSFRVGDGEWQGPAEVLRADRAVRDALGLPHRGGQMVQPWCRHASVAPGAAEGATPTSAVELAWRFAVDAIPPGPLYLCLEEPTRWEARVNGQLLPTENDCGWWVDASLRRVPLDPAFLREGENELSLRGAYGADHPGLEIVYLLGRFGTAVEDASGRITEEPRALSLGDWVPRGLAFYSGSVSYCRRVTTSRKPGDRVFLQCPEYRGVAVRVVVNGRAAGVIAWEPNELDITDALPEGEHPVELRIEVIGHRRNSHGPLHHAKKWPARTGPAEFVTSGADWSETFQLVPCGLLKPPVILVRKPARESEE